MYPFFKIGSIVIPSYVLFVAIGFLFASFLVDYFAEQFSLSKNQSFSAFCASEIGILLGAKLLYIIINIKRIFLSKTPFISILKAGFVLYGGIFGAIIATFLFSKITKKSFYQVLSLIALVGPFIQFFGRIGCFCAGCCYGRPYRGLLSIYIANDFRYPTQIFSAIYNLLLFLIHILLTKKNKTNMIIPIYITFYGFGRFIMEQFRGDIRRGFLGPLSISSWISIFFFIIGLSLLIRKLKTTQVSDT